LEEVVEPAKMETEHLKEDLELLKEEIQLIKGKEMHIHHI
jgi:hypothetical protein